jgi:hypothetical protein
VIQRWCGRSAGPGARAGWRSARPATPACCGRRSAAPPGSGRGGPRYVLSAASGPGRTRPGSRARRPGRPLSMQSSEVQEPGDYCSTKFAGSSAGRAASPPAVPRSPTPPREARPPWPALRGRPARFPTAGFRSARFRPPCFRSARFRPTWPRAVRSRLSPLRPAPLRPPPAFRRRASSRLGRLGFGEMLGARPGHIPGAHRGVRRQLHGRHGVILLCPSVV